MTSFSGTAPVNIALIKYWGKRDESLILPINSSLSITLSQETLRARTKVTFNGEGDEDADRFLLNGREDTAGTKRRAACMSAIRKAASSKHGDSAAARTVRIDSDNSFPTAAGLASSAAGYASLVFALDNVYQLGSTPAEMSLLARQGSGSACRSLMGGFVKWEMGSEADGSDSMAVQVADELHWPELCVLIAVVSAKQKGVSSTSGMQTSVETSPLLKHRAEAIVPGRLAEMEEAIRNKDFEALGRITMMDSNQFHATCLDTYPPISYLTSTSHTIQNLIHRWNNEEGAIKAAYTFDAGPNACILTKKADLPDLIRLICSQFGPSAETMPCSQFLHGPTELWEKLAGMNPSTMTSLPASGPDAGDVQYLMLTGIGGGPQVEQPLQ